MVLAADAAIARITARQHGLITREQCVLGGMSVRQIQRRVESGAWLPIDTSTYRVAAAPFTWSTRVLAPVLATGGLASHRTAAVIWGIGGVRPGQPEITVPRPSRFRRRDVRVHESGDIHLAGRRVRDGIPVTGVGRTLVDLGASAPWTVVEDAMTDALNLRLISWAKVLEAYATHACRGRAGCGALRRVIDKNHKTAIAGSRLELRLERALANAGLPSPDRQIEIRDRAGVIGRVDFAYGGARVVIEVDGRSTHARRLAFEADALRRSRLAAAGWVVIHVTWEQLFADADAVATRVADALAARAA
jgi:very-short-patch-repair endonuclease